MRKGFGWIGSSIYLEFGHGIALPFDEPASEMGEISVDLIFSFLQSGEFSVTRLPNDRQVEPAEARVRGTQKPGP